MKISEIKKWAKEKGYIVTKQGENEEDESTVYSWHKADDNSVCGQAPSVSKVAMAVFNHMTNNRWVEYQEQYRKNQEGS